MSNNKVFPGFSFPEKNHYEFPKDLNGFYDKLTGEEFKVLSYIVRKTWGFNKIEDQISYKQFLQGLVNKDGIQVFSGLGISDYILTKSLRGLKAKGFIEIIEGRGRIANIYRLKYSYPNNSGETTVAPESVIVAPESAPLTIGVYNNTSLLLHNNSVEQAPITTEKFFNFNELLSNLSVSKRKPLRIIGLYWKFKNIQFENKTQFDKNLSRELRAAEALIGYSNKDIEKTMYVLVQQDYLKKWTLETVSKYINEVKAGNISDNFKIPEYALKWQK